MKRISYYKDDPTIKDLEDLYEETADQLMRTTWNRIILRVGTQKIKAQFLGSDKKGVLYFKCNSGTTPGKWWFQKVIFVDLNEAVKMLNSSLLERKKNIIKMLIKGDIKVTCDDPSWHYYFKYTAWKNGYGIDKETRVSSIRNPRQDKSLCKHLYAVMVLLPNISNLILKEYRKKKVLPNMLTRVKNKVKK